jgi:peptide/nickel transport system permease protein
MKRYLAKYLRSPLATAGLGILALALACAVLAPFLAHQDPYNLAELAVADGRLPPGSRGVDGLLYWLGTDDQGRDVLSAILYGLRISLAVALIGTSTALAAGIAVGLSAAYFGGWVDSALMRLADIQLAFPGILIALVLLAVLGTGLDKVIIAIIAVQWAYYARTARSVALVERSKEYVLAARNLQFSAPRIMFTHLLPNCVGALSVVAVVNMAGAIALEATLSFLGVGLPITQPSLGMLIANGYSSMLTGEYWLSFYPGLVLLLLLIGINLIGERLRQLNDPRGVA